MEFSPEQLQAIEGGAAVTITVGQNECVVIRKEIYETIRSVVVPEDLPSVEEQRYLLGEVGKMAGWDDPDMDAYDAP
jgi:hypothetical protein